MSRPKLQVSNLQAWYADSHVLHGVGFTVGSGELVTLIGRNGAGKSTTIRSIMGLLEHRTGSIEFEGRQTIRLLPEQIARAGIAICPEERGIFASLTVKENLLLPPKLAPGGMTLEEIHSLFPNLLERQNSPGTKLSGGEQQMLAIARILRTGASLLLLDEPTEGLAPVIVEQIGNCIRTLKETGFTIILVEQNYRFASEVADRIVVIENGRTVDSFERDSFAAQKQAITRYLGV